MKPEFLGDSYDIVKHCLLRWLASMGPWATHPMFTERASSEQADTYAHLLGTRILSREILTCEVDRDVYLAAARECHEHVFLDPDTGIRLKRKPTARKKAPLYLFDNELVAIADARPRKLTLVFDQSLKRGSKHQELQHKLSTLASHGVHSVAYVSHACFVLAGKDRSLVETALDTLKKESHLPGSRFLAGAPQNKAMHPTVRFVGRR